MEGTNSPEAARQASKAAAQKQLEAAKTFTDKALAELAIASAQHSPDAAARGVDRAQVLATLAVAGEAA